MPDVYKENEKGELVFVRHEPTKGSRYPGVPGSSNETTSKEAADEFQSEAVLLRKKVLSLIDESGPAGMTAYEAVEITGRIKDSIAPRFTELRHKGLIVDSGKKRKTPSGRNCIEWVTK